MFFLRLFFFLSVLSIIAPIEHTLAAPSKKVRVSYEVGFSPKGNAKCIILNAIKKAKKTIFVAAYSFTSKDIAIELVDAYNRGVDVRVIVDEGSSSGKYSASIFLANQGIPVRTNGNYSIFHNKFMVFDGRHVETGSYNYTVSAAKNNSENVLLLKNVPRIAKDYTNHWQGLWEESVPREPNY